MKKIFEKPFGFTAITILCFTLFAAFSCNKSETLHASHTNGIIVGYTKCLVDGDNLIGLFIITEKNDSLLFFNLPLSSISIDPDLLYHYGTYNLNGGNISFDYKIAVGEEIKQITNFLCPQDDMLPGFSHGQIEDYIQIIITRIK